MRTSIETNSGRIHFALPASAVPGGLPWWPRVRIVSSKTEGSPFPWSCALAEGPKVPALRIYSGSYRDRAAALAVLRFQRMILPAAIAEFVDYGFEGTVLPASFLQPEDGGRYGAGHLILGRSPAVRPDAAAATREETYERAFGPGATNLFLSFARAISEAWTASGLPPRRLGQVEIVKATDVDELFVDLLVENRKVLLLAPQIDEEDPIWEPVARAGIEELLRSR